MSSSDILERGEAGTKCKFQGILLFRDSEPRVWSQNAEVQLQSSPKRARKNGTALDIVMCDKTGPMCVTLFGDDLVAHFLQDLQGSASQAKVIDLSVVRIAELKKDAWKWCCTDENPHPSDYATYRIARGHGSDVVGCADLTLHGIWCISAAEQGILHQGFL